MAKIIGINHVQLAMPVGGEVQARKFYGEVLGITEVPKPPALAVRGGAWFDCGTFQLHLGVEADFRPAKKAHPALMVQDLAHFVAQLKLHDCPIESAEPISGVNRVFTSDPFGNKIELMELL